MQSRDDPPPRFCPHCGTDFGDEELEPVPSKVAIGGSAIVKAVDGTYNIIEETSAARAEELNAPWLKTTNMRDNLREGDVAAMPLPNNVITNFQETMRRAYGPTASYGFQGAAMSPGGSQPLSPGGGDPNSYIKGNEGVFTGPGHVALSAAQGPSGTTHKTQLALATAAGQLNRTDRTRKE